MSEYEGILDSLERLHEKLDRLLGWNVPLEASGGEISEVNRNTRVEGSFNGSILSAGSTRAVENQRLTDSKLPVEATTNFAIPMTGEYQWYRLSDQDGKVRKCENAGCDMFLKYSNDKKSYEHWKYDPNTGKGGFVADRCEGVFKN